MNLIFPDPNPWEVCGFIEGYEAMNYKEFLLSVEMTSILNMKITLMLEV